MQKSNGVDSNGKKKKTITFVKCSVIEGGCHFVIADKRFKNFTVALKNFPVQKEGQVRATNHAGKLIR